MKNGLNLFNSGDNVAFEELDIKAWKESIKKGDLKLRNVGDSIKIIKNFPKISRLLSRSTTLEFHRR